MNNSDKMFDKILEDLFKNPPTKEEVEERRREEELQRQRAIENRSQFNAYAMTLPGAEKVRIDNPIMEIRGSVDENGEYTERVVTREEFLEEMLDNLFRNPFDNNEETKEKKSHR